MKRVFPLTHTSGRRWKNKSLLIRMKVGQCRAPIAKLNEKNKCNRFVGHLRENAVVGDVSSRRVVGMVEKRGSDRPEAPRRVTACPIDRPPTANVFHYVSVGGNSLKKYATTLHLPLHLLTDIRPESGKTRKLARNNRTLC